jgi:hypothetical protein
MRSTATTIQMWLGLLLAEFATPANGNGTKKGMRREQQPVSVWQCT